MTQSETIQTDVIIQCNAWFAIVKIKIENLWQHLISPLNVTHLQYDATFSQYVSLLSSSKPEAFFLFHDMNILLDNEASYYSWRCFPDCFCSYFVVE